MSNFLNKMKSWFNPVAVFFHNANKRPGFKASISSVASILIGLVVGLIIMLIVSPTHAFTGLWTLISTGFSDAHLFSRVIFKATPLIFAGLSIAFSFNLGLFNIGITGQVTLGAFTSILAGLSGANWFVCMLVGMFSGALVGFIPALLKDKFHVNEVLSGIMLNWITYYIIGICGNLAVPRAFKDKASPSQLLMIPSDARMPSLGIPGMENISVGLIIAILFIIGIFVILNYTTFGFELKMTGRNASASRYAGVNQSKSTILALTISGALAGICGYMLYAEPTAPSKFVWDSSANTLLADGFTGISVSLIAQNSPIGCLLSSIFLTLIDASSNSLKTISNGAYNVHYTELIKSVIIYVAALSSFFKIILTKLNDKNEMNDYFTRNQFKKARKEAK